MTDEARRSGKPAAPSPDMVDAVLAEESRQEDALVAKEQYVRNEMDRKIAEAITAAGHKKYRVVYEAFETDEHDCPIDNLDQVAVQGPCRFVAPINFNWGGHKSKAYRSPVLHDPTWLQVCVCANAMIKRTRDTHHVFLESIERLSTTDDDGVPHYRFWMGS